jgi:hypothetical protein
MKARSLTPPEDRPTLRTCDACNGSGYITVEASGTHYRKVFCKWCDGQGLSDLRMWSMHQRWLGILRHNQRAGACKKKR